MAFIPENIPFEQVSIICRHYERLHIIMIRREATMEES